MVPNRSANPDMKNKVALFVHHPECSIQSANGILQALEPYYQFKLFTKFEVEKDFFNDVAMVVFPGGIGDSNTFKKLCAPNQSHIKKFLGRGGKYLGICMGAYWADKHYFNLLTDIRVEQYIKRPGADTHRPHPKAQRVLWAGQEEKMFFYDGCAFKGIGLEYSKLYALYPNGDPMAIIQNNIGLIGCHPESTVDWYSDYYTWMRPHYHGGRHHQLLLDFVSDLCKM